jgi:hypothetical protein
VKTECSALLDAYSRNSIRSSNQRLKTGKLQQNEIANKKMARNAIKKMRRFHTESREDL